MAPLAPNPAASVRGAGRFVPPLETPKRSRLVDSSAGVAGLFTLNSPRWTTFVGPLVEVPLADPLGQVALRVDRRLQDALERRLAVAGATDQEEPVGADDDRCPRPRLGQVDVELGSVGGLPLPELASRSVRCEHEDRRGRLAVGPETADQVDLAALEREAGIGSG